ncbi:hypothetical protein ACHAQA_005724 [Verticillium albo-atrum]
MTPHLQLHYDTPAAQWSEALPVGNGRLGAMVHGQPGTEVLQLNEDSVWSGGPQDRTPPDARRKLEELRTLIRAHKHAEAEALVKLAFYANPRSQRHYEPLATAYFEFGHDAGISKYRRSLDLETSQAVVDYEHNGASYRRELIASFPDSALLWRFTASCKTRFVVRLDRVGDDPVETNSYADKIWSEGNRIFLHGNPRGGNGGPRLCAVAAVVCDDNGSIEAIGGCLVITTASCTVAIGAQTTFRHVDPELAAVADIDCALRRPWSELVRRHRDDYQGLFNRMSLRMWPDASNEVTSNRLETKSSRDAGLVALYHNYGRYLLISSSRDGPNPLPANLQGIWNPSFAPPWGSKYTININTQMNYWPAGPCGLANDCGVPAIDLLERMALRGRKTAEAMYSCGGWCAHHNTDIWADTSPQDHWISATVWPLGGLWMCVTLMDMVRFCSDGGRELHGRIFACLEGAVEFVLDFLTPSRDGSHLVTCPSLSPENTFRTAPGEQGVGVLCEGSTMDMTLIRVAFEQFLWSLNRADAAGSQAHPLRQKVQDALVKIPPILVNHSGLVQEWGLDDYEENEPGHRHVSHLVGLHPADLISPEKTPGLAEAARAVLQHRLSHGGGHTGWSRAWLVNMYARLWDGEACGEHVDLLLAQSTLSNLLDTHPPFQIDGLLHTERDFARIRKHVASGKEPWKTGFEKLVARADPLWQPRAAETICRGNNAGCIQNYPVLYRDVHAAYANALYWKVTGNTTHAEAAVRIVDAWSSTMKFLNGSSDAQLVGGIQGYQLSNVAEILRTYKPWKNLDAVIKLLFDVFYESSERFLRTKNGQAPDHYWANWDLAALCNIHALGVLSNNRSMIAHAVDYFKTGDGMGAIENAIHTMHEEEGTGAPLGQNQEAGRDQGHATLVFDHLAVLAQQSYNQGEDLFSLLQNRILAGYEYVAKYNLGHDVPYTTYENKHGVMDHISNHSRGIIRPIGEILYAHYNGVKRLDAPWTRAYRDYVLESGGGAEGGGGYDQLGFSTLLFRRD